MLGLWLIAGSAAVLLLADLVTGTRLQSAALLGDSPLTAGRFYGAGNTAFGVLAVGSLLAIGTGAAALPGRARRLAPAVAAVAAGTVVVVDAAPGLGADLGGVLALGPACLLLVLVLAGVRLSPGRWLAALLAGGVPVLLVAAWDYSRPAERRTHIGRFVAQLIDGRAGAVLSRKAAANLGQLSGSPYLPLVLATVLLAAVLLVRPPPSAPL